MAVLLKGYYYEGLAADAKPTVNVPTNTRFLETDTGDEYLWNGTIWVLQHPGMALGKQSFTNLLDNGNFEIGDPPTGWVALDVNATLSRDATKQKIGSYSLKLVTTASSVGYQALNAGLLAYLKGRTITIGKWVWCAAANVVRLRIDDGVAGTSSAYHTGGSTWEWLTVTRVVDAGATQIWLMLHHPLGAGTSYGDGAILVEGASCPAFSPKPDEALICHHTAAYDLSAYETGHVVHTNLGAGGAIQLELPQVVAAGFTCRFAVMAAFELRIHPGAAGAIYINGAKQLDDKYIWADDEAESIVLTADGNGDWVAMYAVGTWGVE